MNYGFESFYARAQEAAAPLSELTDMGFDAFEKGFQLQTELLGDAIDLAVDELKLVSTATSPTEYFQAQTRLAEQYAARAQSRAQSLSAAASEAQSTLGSWVEQSFKQGQALFAETVAAAQEAAAPGASKAA